MDGGAWCPWGLKESDTTERLHFVTAMFFFNGSTTKYTSLAYGRHRVFQVTEMVKNLPVMQIRIRVRSLGWEDPLERGTTTHSTILARRIPWTQEPGRL